MIVNISLSRMAELVMQQTRFQFQNRLAPRTKTGHNYLSVEKKLKLHGLPLWFLWFCGFVVGLVGDGCFIHCKNDCGEIL